MSDREAAEVLRRMEQEEMSAVVGCIAIGEVPDALKHDEKVEAFQRAIDALTRAGRMEGNVDNKRG